MKQYRYSYPSPLGTITLIASDKGLMSLSLPAYKYDIPVTGAEIASRQPFETVIAQLDRYFAGEAVEFNVTLDLSGTPFQCEVW